MNNVQKEITGKLVKGYQIASGLSLTSPYPKGTIELQKKHFKKLGLDLENFYSATLNISIAPNIFIVKNPDHTFNSVKWDENNNAESFSFIKCQIKYNLKYYNAWIYYPHPDTKIGHIHTPSTIEVIAEYIENISYNDKLTILIPPNKIIIKKEDSSET